MRDAGFRVYAPILFGLPDAGNIEKPTLVRILSLCVSREFTLLAANKSSPVTALGRLAHQECDGRGVGAIGMCLTGGFALSMALDPVVLAPLLAQPGLPATRPGALDISPADLDRVKARTRDGLKLRARFFQFLPNIASREHPNQSTYISVKNLLLPNLQGKFVLLSGFSRIWRCRGAPSGRVRGAREEVERAPHDAIRQYIPLHKAATAQFRWQVGGALSRFHQMPLSIAATRRNRFAARRTRAP